MRKLEQVLVLVPLHLLPCVEGRRTQVRQQMMTARHPPYHHHPHRLIRG
jgi:hypothetical protein